jgi:HD domain
LQANTEKVLAMLIALGDARVMLIKLASRLQQTRNMRHLPPAGREECVRVTQSLFVPLANRLGIWSIKAELEDLCFEVPCSASTCTHFLRKCSYVTRHLGNLPSHFSGAILMHVRESVSYSAIDAPMCRPASRGGTTW